MTCRSSSNLINVFLNHEESPDRFKEYDIYMIKCKLLGLVI